MFQILREARLAPLYHTVGQAKVLDIFTSDLMPARWTHTIPGYGPAKGNSFTRNRHLWWSGIIRLTVDQQKLAANNKIIPLDGEYIYAGGYNSLISDRRMNSGQDNNETLSEEFVLGDIKHLHRVVTEVEIGNIDKMTIPPHEKIEIYKAARAYTKKWGIPFKVAPQFLRDMIDTLRGWREADVRRAA